MSATAPGVQRVRRTGLRAVLPGLLGALLIVVVSALPAWAHAQLIGTDPVEGAVLAEAPERATLTFSEPVRLTAREIVTYDATGTPVPSRATASGEEVTIAFPDGLGRGTHAVVWFVVSADGHPITGTLTFSVGSRSRVIIPPPAPAESSAVVTVAMGALAGLTYLGLLTAAGLVVFAALVLPVGHDDPRLRRRVRRLARLAAGLGAVTAVLQVPVAALYAQGLELTDADRVLASLELSLVRNEAWAAAVLTLGLAVAVGALGSTAPTMPRRALMLAGAVTALAAPVLVGHSRAYGPAALVLGVDLVHLLAGATWLGGLVGLTLLVGRGDDPGAGESAGLAAGRVLGRFSVLAGGLLVVLAVSGVLLGWRILGSTSALTTTTYGVLLLVKVSLALIVATLGGWNRWRLLPWLESEPQRALSRVRRVLLAEALGLTVLLAVTGFLVNRPPIDLPEAPQPPRPVSESLVFESAGDAEPSDLRVEVALTPGGQGPNTLRLVVRDATGRRDDLKPDVELRNDEFDLGAVPLQVHGRGAWQAVVLLPQGGEWQLQVGLRLSRFEHPVSTVRFTVPD